ncbi:MAG: hypothetical protein J4F41_06085 [Alphaproteobacteria bacterium]|nr:hypothetical protein [Alphaproteobacteria bacterium]
MSVKKLYIQRLDDVSAVEERLRNIADALGQSPLASRVSFRAYTSGEDETLLVEKWIYPDGITETSFRESIAPLMDGLPEHNHLDGFGEMIPRSDKTWDE